MTRAATAALCLALLPAAPAAAQAIPDHPEKLIFQPIAFQPPVAKDHRVVLKNGIVVYIAEDRALPLVNIALTVRVGSWLEPAGKEGLAGFTGSQLRRGGTKGLTAEAARREARFPRRPGVDRHRPDLGLRRAQLPLRQPRPGARALRRDAARAALPGGPPRPREGAGAPGDEEAERRLRRHRRRGSGVSSSTARASSRTASRPRPRSRGSRATTSSPSTASTSTRAT